MHTSNNANLFYSSSFVIWDRLVGEHIDMRKRNDTFLQLFVVNAQKCS